MLLIPAIIVILISAKWLLLAFGDNYSENGAALLRILALSGIFMGINSIYSTILRILGRIKELVLICLFTAIMVLTGSYFAMQSSGVVATGYVWLIVQGSFSIYAILALRKYLNKKDSKSTLGI
jgi:O-antigen/teichoic acid export membrane protein